MGRKIRCGGAHHVLAAARVAAGGNKHVLGMREGASENTEVTKALLEDLVERELDPKRRRLFVIDGSKALRKAIARDTPDPPPPGRDAQQTSS